MIRLQKFIADCGVASRRAAEDLIRQGKVSVNGAVVTDMGVKVDPVSDVVYADGKRVNLPEKKVYILLHKPRGYITSAKDQFGRKDVSNLVADVPARLFPVGRLDFDTSGLLLMTNDGDLTYKLTHPKFEIEKVYIARVLGKADETALGRLREGVLIDEKMTAPAKAALVKDQGGSSSIRIAITEGRNRQVRKMLDAVGLKVLGLKRVATGKIYLGDLESGKYRHLSKDEVKYLKSL